MVQIELSKEEVQMLIGLMDSSSVAISKAKEAADMYDKIKNALK